jgi:hypothetical protein
MFEYLCEYHGNTADYLHVKLFTTYQYQSSYILVMLLSMFT